ncbi:MAG: GTP-binding protein [Halothiobacillaceae bacterium]|nr:GTP-binding protein [Halothiobacillaceae bacterium]
MTANVELIETDIEAYLKAYLQHDMLRFITCGSVDDGKSSLIGRLLYDSNQIFEDHMQVLKKDSAKVGTTGTEVDLALLVDGLESEREQGITIDVAYRYFTTEKRKFIIADTPGHEQYTRNMATGASTADLAVILVDARKGLLPQTKRHSYIVNLLGIRHIIVAINKMDLVGYDMEVFERIRSDYQQQIAAQLDFVDIRFVPVSALLGDNVVYRGDAMPWYQGQTLKEILESIDVSHAIEGAPLRFPVQYVNRPNLDFRGYCGTVASGSVSVGDTLTVLPSGKSSQVKSIVTQSGDLASADVGMAVTLTLEDEIDISRGNVLVRATEPPTISDRLSTILVWMYESAMLPG